MKIFTSEIKKIGFDLGFDKIGITPATQPSKSKNLVNWLNKGFAGTMDWMAIHHEKRMDVRTFFLGQNLLFVSPTIIIHLFITPIK